MGRQLSWLGGAKAGAALKDIFISLQEEKTTLLFPYQKSSFDSTVHGDKEAQWEQDKSK